MNDLLEFEKKVKTLTNDELVEQMGALFQREKKIGDAILLGLKKIKHRRVFAAMGYASLFEFLNKHFKLSESSCYQRIQALKLIESSAEIQSALFKSEVSMSNLANVQTFIGQIEKATQQPLPAEKKKEIVEVVKGKTVKEAQAALLNSPLALQNPKATLPPTKEKSLIQNHTQLQLTLDSETMAKLKEIRDLLGHTIPSGDYSQVVKYLATQMLETLQNKKGRVAKGSAVTTSIANSVPISDLATTLGPSTTSGTDVSGRAHKNEMTSADDRIAETVSKQIIAKEVPVRSQSRAVPQAIKRKVFERSGGRCEYVGANGYRCNSQFQLEVDHIVPWSQGGTHDPALLQIVCRSHNQFRVKETHGFFYKKVGTLLDNRDGRSR